MSKQLFSNFSKGEIGPQLLGRIDTAQYEAGAKKVRNFIIQRYGGLSFRPGFRLVGEADTLDDSTLFVPFQYNIDQSYVVTLAEESLRLLSKGGFILEDNLKITGATKEAQAVLTIAYHDWEIGDRIYLSGVEGMTELNGQFVRIVDVIDDSHVRTDVDSRTFTTFVSSDGTARVGAPAPPPPPPPPPPVVVEPEAPPETGGGGGSGSDLGSGGRRGISYMMPEP